MTDPRTRSKTFMVGLLVSLALVVLMVFIFAIGSEQKLFSSKYTYKVRFDSASGLNEGNPVQLSGITIGSVRDIRLPRDPKNQLVEITIEVQKKFAERIRQDSRARLKKLGLIAADTYIDITPGSPELPLLPPGSIIPSARQTNVDALIASGEDLVDNFVQISHSLKNVLARVDAGEGLLGELTTSPATKQKLTDTLMVTLNRTNSILEEVQQGNGLVGRLIYDDAYAANLTTSLNESTRSLQTILASVERSFESGEGMLPALLNDPQGREKVMNLVTNLETTSENLVLFSQQMKEGEGIVPRLLNDREFGDQTLGEFRQLVQRLNETARMLQEGDGTAGRLISDPAVYEAVNDILIGINESAMLRWLVRNRQKKGIETRVEAATGQQQAEEKREKSVIAAPKPETPPVTEPPKPKKEQEPEETPPPSGFDGAGEWGVLPIG